MTNDFLAFAPMSPVAVPAPAAAGAADQDLLDEMMARVGVDGLAAAFAHPALLALLDQHAAMIREAVAGADRQIDAAGLAAYARSIIAAARRMGRPLPEAGQAYTTGADWLRAEWHLLRLLAACLIAASSGVL